MDLDLAGKRTAVGAATAGLGFASAAALAAEGASVAICGRDRARVQEAAGRLGGSAVGLVADLSTAQGAKRFVQDAQEALGGLDILVTNGPGPRAGTVAGVSPGDYQQALESNLLSVVEMCYAAVPQMRAQGWGRVVAITSVTVRQPIPNLVLSTTARAGVTGFLKTLAREVAGDGVTVNSVQPGTHDTDRVRAVYGDRLAEEVTTIPVGRIGQPSDFGAVVAFLCSGQARFITGAAIPVDGGSYRALL